jgi:hypothetical protein
VPTEGRHFHDIVVVQLPKGKEEILKSFSFWRAIAPWDRQPCLSMNSLPDDRGSSTIKK